MNGESRWQIWGSGPNWHNKIGGFLCGVGLGLGILWLTRDISMPNPTLREQAANLLQRRICEAICDKSPEVKQSARAWLHLDEPPSAIEKATPTNFSFIGACQELGVDWAWLNSSMKQAVRLDGSFGLIGDSGSITATKENLPQFCGACYKQLKLINGGKS